MNDAFHKFAPLTDAERMAVPAVAEEHDDGKHVSPIPADVPKTDCRFGRPTTTSVYRDEQGATLFRVLRTDPPGERKIFRNDCASSLEAAFRTTLLPSKHMQSSPLQTFFTTSRSINLNTFALDI
jgi:hypothetical protein